MALDANTFTAHLPQPAAWLEDELLRFKNLEKSPSNTANTHSPWGDSSKNFCQEHSQPLPWIGNAPQVDIKSEQPVKIVDRGDPCTSSFDFHSSYEADRQGYYAPAEKIERYYPVLLQSPREVMQPVYLDTYFPANSCKTLFPVGILSPELPPPAAAWLPNEILKYKMRELESSYVDSASCSVTKPRNEIYRKNFCNPESSSTSYSLKKMELFKYLPSLECRFCKSNGATPQVFKSHPLRSAEGKVVCSVLRSYSCPNCFATGDDAHTLNYCPLRRHTKVSPTNKMKSTSRNAYTVRCSSMIKI